MQGAGFTDVGRLVVLEVLNEVSMVLEIGVDDGCDVWC